MAENHHFILWTRDDFVIWYIENVTEMWLTCLCNDFNIIYINMKHRQRAHV